MPEPRNGNTVEIPDAIGWLYTGHSRVIECKASRADFKADARKLRCGGMGNRRYYLAEGGLIRPDELTDGWGLIEPKGSRFTVVKEADDRESYIHAERALLIAEFRPDTPSRCLAQSKQP